MKKADRLKLEVKYEKLKTPFDDVIKETVAEIQDTRQFLIHSKYNIDYLNERVERLELMLLDYKEKAEDYKNEDNNR